MRACVQCGLSIGETATFCPVCGARYDAAGVATLVASQDVQGPQGGVAPGADPVDRWAEAQEYEPGAELVADLADEKVGAGDLDLDACSSSVVVAEAPAPEAEPERDATPELDAAAPEVESAPVPTARERKLAEVAVLLGDAARCEEEDMPRAAAMYQEAIVGCLEACGEAEGLGGADAELLRGFDGLSSLLERSGLAEEALAVVTDAEALGLLAAGPDAAGHRSALRRRREDLRRLLFADSAQL